MLWASVKFTRMPHEIGKQKYVNQHVNLEKKSGTWTNISADNCGWGQATSRLLAQRAATRGCNAGCREARKSLAVLCGQPQTAPLASLPPGSCAEPPRLPPDHRATLGCHAAPRRAACRTGPPLRHETRSSSGSGPRTRTASAPASRRPDSAPVYLRPSADLQTPDPVQGTGPDAASLLLCMTTGSSSSPGHHAPPHRAAS